MLTPTLVDLEQCSYLIGNTPAVNLLRDFRPPDQGIVNILLLGCGDVRNILFSLWSEGVQSGCRFHFTACDSDPAVLAKNIFLLTAIAQSASTLDKDKALLARLYRTYYHFFVTRQDVDFIQQHANRLCVASQTLQTWLQSPFASVFAFSNESTLAEVRSFWLSHAQERTADQDRLFRQAVTSRYNHYQPTRNDVVCVSHGLRSAGIHGLEASPSMNRALERFWETGVVAGNDEDVAKLIRHDNSHVNPLMSTDSNKSSSVVLRYGVEPLLGFHLAQVFDSPRSENEELNRLANLAKSQFSNWCRTFAQHAASGSVNIMHHCGEAVNFSHALQAVQGSSTLPSQTYFYARPWSATPLSLNATLTTRFDVIDTSSIIDHVGLLNVLPAVIPLMTSHPGSVLYVETLLQAAETPERTLDKLFHADVMTLSLLLGVTPVGHVLGTTVEPIYGEQFYDMVCPPTPGRPQQFRLRIPFRRPWQGGSEISKSARCDVYRPFPYRLKMDANELASFLMQMYLSLFQEAEDVTKRMAVMMRKANRPLAGDVSWYSRLSFVTLLATIKRVVLTDWRLCIDSLVARIEADRSLLIGSNALQELYLHLHRSGLRDEPLLMTNPRMQMTPFGETRAPGEPGMLGEQELPGMVHIALIVPRSNLLIFTGSSNAEGKTPGLRLAVFNDHLFDDYTFNAIDTFFGRIEEPLNGAGEAVVDEDPMGWSGESDMIVTCEVPTWPLLVGRREDVRVALVVNPNATMDTSKYILKLGGRTMVFIASLESKNLRILTQAPLPRFVTRPSFTAPPNSPIAQEPITPDSTVVHLGDNGDIKAISIVSNFLPGSPESEVLKNGTEVKVSQLSPCVFAASLGHLVHYLFFPYPMNGSSHSLKIARKSSWIELSASVSNALQPGGFALDPFPVISQGDGEFLAWGMGRVNNVNQLLAKLPLKSSRWLESLFSMASSQNERVLNAPETPLSRKPLLLQLKESLPLMFFASVGFHPEAPGTIFRFFLIKVADMLDTIIIVKALRHDRDTGAIFLDAFVVPVDSVLRNSVSFKELVDSHYSREGATVPVTNEQLVLYKQLFPAIAERCRTWKHGSDCKYNAGSIPLSTVINQASICDCGMGKDAKHMPYPFEAFAHLATRIAIPLLCAVPYVEPMLPSEPEHEQTSQKSDACGNCGTSGPDMKICSRCEKVKYCDRACQEAAWKTHKKECKR